MQHEEDITFDEEIEEPDLDISDIDYAEIADEIDEDYEPLEDEEDELDDHDTEPEPPKAELSSSSSEDDDEEDEDEEDEKETEADLEAILRDRLASEEDIDEADEVEGTGEGGASGGPAHDVEPRRDDEFLCEGCFLLVTPSQFGSRSAPRCPSGEEICPAMDKLK